MIKSPRIWHFLLGVAIAWLLPCHLFAESAPEVANKAYWLCKNRRDVRTIRIQVSAQGVCSTIYSKEGSEKLVGSGKSQESCVNFLNNVKANLEKSNYTCRDIGDTKITAGIE